MTDPVKEIINNFQRLGVSRREAEVYVALLQKKNFTAAEVAKITTITRTKSYEVLQNLVKKGLCTFYYINGKKTFTCVEPKIALQNIISSYEEVLTEKKKIADDFRDELTTLYEQKSELQQPLDFVEVLSDGGQIAERFNALQENTKEELLIFTKPPYNGTLEDNVDEQSKLPKKKVKFKSIYDCSEIKTKEEKEEFIKIIEQYVAVGEEARIAEELPMKLVVSDKSTGLFSLRDSVSLKPTLTTVIVNHPSFAFTLYEVFQSYWEKSITLEQYKRKKL